MENSLSAVKQLLTTLSSEQRDELLEFLQDDGLVEEVLGMSGVRPECCRCCGHKKFICNGKETVSGRQRYLCKKCNGTFTSMTGTVLDNIQKKGDFIRYVKSFIKNHTLREAADIYGIALNTSFDWRHRLLSALGLSTGDVNLSGKIEADEKYVPFSAKGQPDVVEYEQRKPRKRGSDRNIRGISNEQVCILTAMDSSGAILLSVVKRGRIDSASVEKELGHRIRKKPVNRDILVTDSESAYNSIVRDKNLIHKIIPTGKHSTLDGANIQKINSLHSRLDKWMTQFNGVATKYLQNYMNYFVTLEKSKNVKERFLKIWEWLLIDKQAFISYGQLYQHISRT